LLAAQVVVVALGVHLMQDSSPAQVEVEQAVTLMQLLQ
jgi:hypothetical protein